MKRTLALAALSAALAAAAPPLKIAGAGLLVGGEEGKPAPAAYEYYPGEPLYFAFRVAGYTAVKDRVALRFQILATDPDGILLVEPRNGEVNAEMYENDKNWLPKVTQTLTLPPLMAGGPCRLRLKVIDGNSKAEAEETLEFRVRRRAFTPSAALVVRDIRFFADERELQVVDPPVYAPGAAVFARFELAGFKTDGRNRFELEYGLAVYRPSGKLLYAEPQAAKLAEQPFYPKRWQLGSFSLTLSADLTPGVYTVVVQARDTLGGQTAEAKTAFEVRKP